MNSLTKYFSEVKIELSKIIWPKRQVVVRLTLIVLVFSVLVGIYAGGLDFLFTKLLGFLLTK